MKPSFLFFLGLIVYIASLLAPIKSLAIEPAKPPIFLLKAKKGAHTKEYKVKDYIRIVYINAHNGKHIAKGKISALNKDSIFIQPFQRNLAPMGISLSDISSLQKIHVKGRRGWKFLIIGLVLLTIIGLITINSPSATIFLSLPVGSLFVIPPYLVANFLADILSKKSKNKGWVFSIEEE
ncbi:MAG: hypothetical protein RIR12_2338 [Bacteroidota bacterium]|jgi:hypothetical protein